jgi:hypothetical protein
LSILEPLDSYRQGEAFYGWVLGRLSFIGSGLDHGKSRIRTKARRSLPFAAAAGCDVVPLSLWDLDGVFGQSGFVLVFSLQITCGANS